ARRVDLAPDPALGLGPRALELDLDLGAGLAPRALLDLAHRRLRGLERALLELAALSFRRDPGALLGVLPGAPLDLGARVVRRLLDEVLGVGLEHLEVATELVRLLGDAAIGVVPRRLLGLALALLRRSRARLGVAELVEGVLERAADGAALAGLLRLGEEL